MNTISNEILYIIAGDCLNVYHILLLTCSSYEVSLSGGVKHFHKLFGICEETDGPLLSQPGKKTLVWRNADGVISRVNGPAIIYDNNVRVWFDNYRVRRDDGPAIQFASGVVVYVENERIMLLSGGDGTADTFAGACDGKCGGNYRTCSCHVGTTIRWRMAPHIFEMLRDNLLSRVFFAY